MAVKKHKNGSWMYDIRHPKTKKRRRINGFDTRSEADQARSIQLDKWRAEKHGIEVSAPKLGLLLKEELIKEVGIIFEEFPPSFDNLTIRQAAGAARDIANRLVPSGLRVTEFNDGHLKTIIDRELKRGLKPGSLKSKLTSFNMVLRRIIARHKGTLDHWTIPIAKVPGFVPRDPRKLRRPWTEEETAKVLHVLANPKKYYPGQRRKDAISTWRDVHDLLVIAALTGMRKSEVTLIEISKIFLHWNVMQARTLKRKNRVEVYRDIPLSEELRELLEERIRYVGDAKYLFPKWYGKVQSDWIYHNLRMACEIAGVPYGQKQMGVVPHGLRHGAATQMLLNGTDITTAAEILGNSVETMLNSYAHTTIESKRAALRSLSVRVNKPEHLRLVS